MTESHQLIEILLEMTVLRDLDNRNRLLHGLPPGPEGAIRRHPAWQTDLYNIVEAAEEWGKPVSGEWPLVVIAQNALSLAEGTQPGRKLETLIEVWTSRAEKFKAGVETINLLFVVAAMTREEADNLARGTDFDDPHRTTNGDEQFQAFKNMLQEYEVDDTLPYYDENRDNWQPPHHQQITIQQTIRQMIERANQAYVKSPGAAKILPQFISEDFFAEDRRIRAEAWQLANMGCIIVVDSISLFHPWIYQTLSSSEVSSKKQIAMFILSPINFSKMSINQSLEEKIMEWVKIRSNNQLDKLCEFGAGDPVVLQRWLFTVLPDLVRQRQEPEPTSANREAMRKLMKQRPRGIMPLNW